MSPHKMATSSSMALVDELLKLVQVIASTAEGVNCHKKSCWNLSRLIKLLIPLFEEIREVKSPLPPAAVVRFQDLRASFQKSQQLMEQCRDGSRLFMIMVKDRYHQQFSDVAAELTRALDGLPLDLLAVSEEIQEQTQLVPAQLKRFRNMEDAQEEQLYEDILSLLEEEKIGSADAGFVDPIVGKLGLTSLPAVRSEISALEKEKIIAEEEGRSWKDISQAILLMKRVKTSLGGAESDEEDDADAIVLSTNGPQPPDDFKCPISLELMRDPVIVSTGQTYDRPYIEQWLKAGHKTCPKTQQTLSQLALIPNYSLRSLILQWCDANGVELPKKLSKGGVSRVSVQEKTDGEAGDRALVISLRDRLQHGEVESRRGAAEELRRLAKRSNGNRVCIAEAGVIPVLVNLLKSEDQKIQEHAVTALLNLSINDHNKSLIVGAIEPIVHVLETGSTEAKENAAATLFSLSVIDENKISIGQTGAIPALVNLLQNGSQRGKKDAATALFNLSIYSGNKARAVRAGIVAPLMELLTNRRAGMIDEALAILAILATSLEGRNSIGQASAVPVLVEIITTGSSRNKENSASVLLSLCTNGTNHTEEAIRLNAMTPLTVLLRHGTPRAKRKASQLLQHIRDHQNQ